jgi:hypothetical protein
MPRSLGFQSRIRPLSFELAPCKDFVNHPSRWHAICTYRNCGLLGRTPQSPRPLTPRETSKLTGPVKLARANFVLSLPSRR